VILAALGGEPAATELVDLRAEVDAAASADRTTLDE